MIEKVIRKDKKPLNSTHYDAYIIIDMQRGLLDDHPYNGCQIVENIQKLLMVCRTIGVPVIHVRHDGGLNDPLEKNSVGWQICEELTPNESEIIIDKEYNSMFRKTKLEQILQSLKAKNIMMSGMQTEFCFDVSCKVAFEKEYLITIPKDTTTTFDSDFASGKALSKYYEEVIWDHRYANVKALNEIIEELSND